MTSMLSASFPIGTLHATGTLSNRPIYRGLGAASSPETVIEVSRVPDGLVLDLSGRRCWTWRGILTRTVIEVCADGLVLDLSGVVLDEGRRCRHLGSRL